MKIPYLFCKTHHVTLLYVFSCYLSPYPDYGRYPKKRVLKQRAVVGFKKQGDKYAIKITFFSTTQDIVFFSGTDVEGDGG